VFFFGGSNVFVIACAGMCREDDGLVEKFS
jgi:hypothetical protein